ncbi:MAG: penicillin-binding protein 2 [Burkholderiales bacterium]|jgi:cell division protein FtsI (penicillin-binding protein 3)|nr:penicillin-binding protein 2 [Burkholderiales bacterium]
MLANQDIQKLYWRIKNPDAFSATGANTRPTDRAFVKPKDRTSIVNYIALALTCGVLLRLTYINTISSDFLTDQLNTRVLRTVKLSSMRGTITDRNNSPLAVSTPVEAVWADPSELSSLTATQLQKLADTLAMPISELNKKLNDKNKTFVYLKRSLPPQQAKIVQELGIEGVYTMQEYKRFYPSGEITAHVVGFNNIDDRGADGMEYASERLLEGSDGSKQIIRDLRGHVVENVGVMQPAQNGKQVALSIDNRIQYIAYNALKNQVALSAAKGGSAVVLDAKTGEVLAMINMPTYNPNNRENVTPDMLKNRAATNVYDPGSIMKPLVIAKALDLKMVTPQTVFDTHPWSVGPKLIKDDHPYPHMTVAEIIQHSSDIGTSKIAMKFKAHDLWDYYRQVGFGQKMGTGFPGETKGILIDWKRWYPVDQALMSYGYGISVSLFQMAHAYTIFTNSGCMVPVTFTRVDGGDKLPCTQVISPATAETVRSILASTTEEGTGKNARVADYTVAGKTGTAQVLDGAHYSNTKHIGSFVGFAPAINPRIIVAVMIDQPTKGMYYGAQTAAPVFAQIVQPTLHVLGVNPDKK